MKRLCPKRELPPYHFEPGVNTHPLKPGGHMFEQQEPQTTPLTKKNYSTHQDYLYSLDLINNGYYWEAHAYLEAIWNEANRKGNVADLCKALIKVAAFGVKRRQEQMEPAIAHLKRAEELFKSLPSLFLGLNIQQEIEKLDSKMEISLTFDESFN